MTTELTTADLAAAQSHDPRSVIEPKEELHERIALFSDEQIADLRNRWTAVQGDFVDEPRGAVDKANALVADAITKLTEGFARTRAELDQQWKRAGSVSTEDLRQALRHYRSFFDRILNV
jgi:hypothetical protein